MKAKFSNLKDSNSRMILPIIFIILSILLLLSGRLITDGLPSWAAFAGILNQALFISTIAFGEGLVMLTGGLDLSSAGIIGLSATIVALRTTGHPKAIIPSVLIALLFALIAGFVNGYLIAIWKIPAFIVTLAMNGILGGITIGLSYGRPAPPSPDLLNTLFTGAGRLYGIVSPVYFFFLVLLIGFLIQNKSIFGRKVYHLGSSSNASRISGLKTNRVEISVYMISAVGSCLAGLMLLGFSGASELNLGTEWVMPAISTVLIGGTMIGSGRGFWISTSAAGVFLVSMSLIIQTTGVSIGWQSVLYGFAILISLVLTQNKGVLSKIVRKR